MKLITYIHQEKSHLGAVLDFGRVVNLAQAYSALRQSGNHSEALTVDDFPTDMLTFLQGGDEMWEAAVATVNWVQSAKADGLSQTVVQAMDQIQTLPPLRNPSKIVCIGLNYHDHCRETGTAVPESPVTFVKYPSAIIGPEEEITWPSEVSNQVDYEAELAFVVKHKARNVSAEAAFDYIAGYTILNDISARDIQFADGQWVRGKSFDTFCPLGPYLVTPDEVGDPHRLGIRCLLNGMAVQDSNTSELIFKIPELMAFITKTCTHSSWNGCFPPTTYLP